MRYLVLSDIHANIDALEAVLGDADARGYDCVVVLGDLVGYGAEPGAVIDRVRGLPVCAAVRGNHDKVAAGIGDGSDFNPIARASAEWTARTLTDDQRTYLRELPLGPAVVDDVIEICHGSPDDEDRYVFDSLDAIACIQASIRPVCLFGHTHSPLAVGLVRSELTYLPADGGSRLEWLAEGRYLVNVGSVGQPRDGDPRAAYGIVDTRARAVTFVRLDYPLGRAQDRIRAAGLPEPLATRLGAGR
jgi:diadenosine tetraphosphatase ApaH/serine/threonine PP2A family protein phosphatase